MENLVMRPLATALAAADACCVACHRRSGPVGGRGDGTATVGPEDRYLLAPAGKAFLRLDRGKRRVAECRRRGGLMLRRRAGCAAGDGAGDFAAERRTAALRDENAALQKRLGETGDAPPPGRKTRQRRRPDPARSRRLRQKRKPSSTRRSTLPKGMRRFFGLMKTLREEYDDMAN
ncbi:MAG: hypothetical protein HPM95_04505 [Alphaproteobacteria bacterium]|nr:hypothetical protein [Alphaproteobacteria bacterium]